MQGIHADWRLLQLPGIDGDGSCHRLCHHHTWIGDYHTGDLHEHLTTHHLSVDDFTTADADACVMVDPSSRTACLRPAEPVDGHAHLPLCAGCRRTLATMRGFPRSHDGRTPTTVIAVPSAAWPGLNDDQKHRELSHHLRHPVTKILGWAEILHDDDTLHPAHAAQLQVILRSARDLQQLLDAAATTR